MIERRYYISRAVYDATLQFLQNLGDKFYPGAIVWGGYIANGNCYVMTYYGPEICPEVFKEKYKMPESWLEEIKLEVMRKIWEGISDRKQKCIAIVRTFPPHASDQEIQNQMDGYLTYALPYGLPGVTLFVVVPDYGKTIKTPSEFLRRAKFNELVIIENTRMWRTLEREEIKLEIVNYAVEV